MRRLNVSAIAIIVFVCTTMRLRAGDEISYWVWHRTAALTEAERGELARQKVDTLYWHAGLLENQRGAWHWREKNPLPAATTESKIVPVLRLENQGPEPFAGEQTGALVEAVAATARRAGSDEVQLDFDCPDRLLGAYATALAEIAKAVPRLSITALGGWIRRAEWPRIEGAVAEIFPMLYDLRADPPGVDEQHAPPPLLDPEIVDGFIREWNRCGKPWRVGLPAMPRVSVFDGSGRARGQVRNWSWDALCFNTHLANVGPVAPGVALLRAEVDLRLGNSAVARGSLVACRWPERAALAHVLKTARASAARGVVFFRLPDGSDASGWSLGQLRVLSDENAREPTLTLRRSTNEQWELMNVSDIDLAPRLSGTAGPLDRGYALEIDAPAAVWREAVAGDFWQVRSHADPETKSERPSPIPLATRLTFWFSHLRAGGVLRTGWMQLAPGVDASRIRYRILNCASASEWKKPD